MANDFSANPWRIDTASADVLSFAKKYLKKVRWVGASAIGHTVELRDAAGKLKWDGIAALAANNLIEDSFPREDQNSTGGLPIDGVKVPVLGSGVLELYF